MFRNHFKIAWRNISRHKVYASINVLGLSLGLCTCLVIYELINFEFSFDRFHPDKERIFCVDAGVAGGSHGSDHWNSVPAPLPAAMANEMTGIETVAPFQLYDAKVSLPGIRQQQRRFENEEGIVIAGPEYFDIFKYT